MMFEYYVNGNYNKETEVCFATYRHVGSASSISRFGYGVDKLSTDAKVTKFDIALFIQ